MSNPAPQLVQKLWNYCNILRDDGLSYGDYVEQLTFLLFLKMADEQSRPPFNPPSQGYGGTGKPSAVPKEFAWPSLLARDGDELETHYRHVLESLGKQKGMLGVIFRKAQNKIQDQVRDFHPAVQVRSQAHERDLQVASTDKRRTGPANSRRGRATDAPGGVNAAPRAILPSNLAATVSPPAARDRVTFLLPLAKPTGWLESALSRARAPSNDETRHG